MYVMNVEYQIGEEIKQAVHAVVECHDHISSDDSSCRIVVPKDADVSAYEAVALHNGKITKLILTNEEDEELYVSTRWPVVTHVHKSFNVEGHVNREIVLGLE